MEQNQAKNTNRHRLFIVVIAIILILLEIAGNLPNVTNPFTGLELATWDTFFRLRGQRPPDNDIVIVAIDDASLNWVQERWPWQRSRLADIVNWLSKAGARVIGLDIFLFDPSAKPGEDQALANALAHAKATVSVNQIHPTAEFNGVTNELPLPIFQTALSSFGITEVIRDQDAITRGVTGYESFDNQNYYNWAFELARLYLGFNPPSNPSPAGLTFNGKFVPLNNKNRLLIDFAGPSGTYIHKYSAAFVPLGDYPQEVFRNKIVLIGSTSETLQDYYPTPFSPNSPTPGVEVVANTVATILQGNYLNQAPPWTTIVLIILAAIAAWFISRIPRPTLAIILLAGGLLGYFFIQFEIFVQTRWEFAVITPATMLFLGVIIPTLDQAVSQELEKRRVRNLFSRFISPEMVSQLIDTQNINSLNRRTELTILFSDIRGFTTISEKLKPEEVVSLLNPYLAAMTNVIHKHGGTVDKYEGDAIVAFFGEPIHYPDHARRAVLATLEMRQVLYDLNRQWKTEGRSKDGFEMGIGLNTGEVFVGLLGSEQRMNYTIIGDNANLASRLQDLTKEFGWPILISESTYQQVKDEFDAEFADSRLVKGKTEPVGIYKLLGAKGAPESELVKPLFYYQRNTN
ncbi:MAG: adenylate/guanylate cyclase domain-containing protein [Anaerolineaceae bacterium]|jgi:adenylate cyclase